MYSDIEALVLSGELFNGPSRSSSPARSVSPSSDAGWHDDELSSHPSPAQPSPTQPESIGMKPGRTGVKGVIRDRDEAVEIERGKRNRELEDVRRRMEKGNLGGKTFLEEEREKGDGEKVDEIVQIEREKKESSGVGEREGRKDVFGRVREGRFGHLREVGVRSFVGAVEKEEVGVWVVVHLYEPSLDRCFILDDTLAQLARLYPDTKFLRCRASALGFATSTSAPSHPRTHTRRAPRPIRKSGSTSDSDDPFDEKSSGDNQYGSSDDGDEEDGRDPYEEDNVDLDMLPTVLVYRDGELVFNWVRVDWEAGDAGVEELFDRHHILPSRDVFGTFEVPSDGEEDDGLLLNV